MSNGWETVKSIGAIGGAIAAVLTFIGAIINRFYKFVTWTDLRRTVAAITQTQAAATAAETARVNALHAVNIETARVNALHSTATMTRIEGLLTDQNTATALHRENVSRAINSLVTDMAVVKQRVSHLEGDSR